MTPCAEKQSWASCCLRRYSGQNLSRRQFKFLGFGPLYRIFLMWKAEMDASVNQQNSRTNVSHPAKCHLSDIVCGECRKWQNCATASSSKCRYCPCRMYFIEFPTEIKGFESFTKNSWNKENCCSIIPEDWLTSLDIVFVTNQSICQSIISLIGNCRYLYCSIYFH